MQTLLGRGGSNYYRERHLSTTHRLLSCPSMGMLVGCGHPVAAAAALPMREVNHEDPRTVGMTSLRAAAGGLLLLLRMPLLLPKTGNQSENPASQKNEPEMPLACP